MSEGYTPQGLDDILNGTAEGPPRDEQGRFAPKSEPEPVQETDEPAAPVDDQPEPQPEVTSTSEPEPEPQAIPFKALKDERAKRQQLEAELAQLRTQIQQPQQPQYQPQPQFHPEADEVPDPVVDPAGYADWVESRALARINTQRVAQSAQAARGRYQDFDQAVQAFQQMAQVNPMLEQMMLQQPDPAEWAYRTAKTHLEVTQYGGLDQAVEARVQAALAAEMEKLKAQAAKPQVPTSLATERNVGQRTASVPWVGPTPLDSILTR